MSLWTGSVAVTVTAVGLAALGHVPVRMLSTGQAKRASLARVAASGAPLWLLDEPGNGLDTDGLTRLEVAMATFPEQRAASPTPDPPPLT